MRGLPGRALRRQRAQSIPELASKGKRKRETAAHLHGTTINQKAIQLLGSFGSRFRLGEDDRSNATAGAILVVSQHNLFDRACGLGKVFL